MSEPVRLGEVLLEVMSDITKRMTVRCSIFIAIPAEKAILDARSNIKNRESRNDYRCDDSSIAYAGGNLPQGKEKHHQKHYRPIEKQVQYLNLGS